LLSLKEKAGENSTKTLRVLLKYPDLTEFSARIILTEGEYTKSVENFLRHLMSTHFSGFRKDFMCLFKKDRIQSEAGYKPRE